MKDFIVENGEPYISIEVIRNLLKDPTLEATGQYAQGYRDSIEDIKREITNLWEKQHGVYHANTKG